ncbi:hypothetical protein [Bacillus xiapuensis]|uniref:AP2/ERF domain-containing protein n=1 Tax=Bacillus xiapuensis TaxID=2014075 RepID=A0ABU6N896_9BACI|nr:hypothetical protein [Bacillus xiapuensis]
MHSISDSKTKRMIYKEQYLDRIGETKTNSYGSKMVIDEYNNSKDIWVRFVEYDYLVHTTYKNFSTGSIDCPYDKTVFGFGYLGNGIYKTKINGEQTLAYKTWKSMIERCHSKRYQQKCPTYIDCNIYEEWYNFQNFAKWFDKNYYEIEDEKMGLDKDILVKGNKTYSPETCIFVPTSINSLFTKTNSLRGNLPIGVHFFKQTNKYLANCRNGKGKKIGLGSFNTPDEAFRAYKEFKEKLIKQIAEDYKNKIPDKLYEAMLRYEVEITD